MQDEMRLAKTLAVGTFGSFGSFGPVPSCCKLACRFNTHWSALRYRPRRLRRAPGISHFATVTQPRASSAPPSRPPTTHHGAAPAPAFPPWWILLSRCETGHCTVGSFGSVAGSTDSRDLFAPHDLRIQHSPQPVALALRNKRYKMNSFSK